MVIVSDYEFQSAPLTDVRGDSSFFGITNNPMKGFNPLPSRM